MRHRQKGPKQSGMATGKGRKISGRKSKLSLASPPWKFPPRFATPPATDPRDHVLVLGCGTSSGCPILACTCPTCTSKDPKNIRQRASVVIRAEGKTFLIDTSPDLRNQALQNELYWIDAILYTHPHADHMHGLDEVRSFNFLMGKRIPAFGNEWTLSEIRQKFSYVFEKTQEGGGKPALSLELIDRPRVLEGVKVTPLKLIHGEMPVLGYRIKDIAYITDCSYVPEPTFRSLKNLEILVLDCLRFKKHSTHLSVDEAIVLANRIGAKRTYFTHMGHEIEYNQFARSLPKGMYPAYDGLVAFSS